MKTLGPHPITADSLHFRRTLDTMIHAWVLFRSRADFPGRMNVVYKKLHIQGPSEGFGWEEGNLPGGSQRVRDSWEVAWGRSREPFITHPRMPQFSVPTAQQSPMPLMPQINASSGAADGPRLNSFL